MPLISETIVNAAELNPTLAKIMQSQYASSIALDRWALPYGIYVFAANVDMMGEIGIEVLKITTVNYTRTDLRAIILGGPFMKMPYPK